MQFVKNGPNVPLELIQAHERGKVMFFCGSGISYPAGLPLFKGLVENIYQHMSTSQTLEETQEFEFQKYDTVLHLLEKRSPHGKRAIRKALFETLSLEPNSTTLINHTSLLKLARTSNGKLRLITTNFDLLFQEAARSLGINFKEFSAPALPIADKNLDGLVYIHGILPEHYDENSYELENIILTSGDFGRAYLLHGWASRFLVKLFSNYIICFVGYSLNDPLLRYITDALLAEKEQGENCLPSFAFASFDKDKSNETTCIKSWKNKGITHVIPYPDSDSHELLTITLKEWANEYSEDIKKQCSILSEILLSDPVISTDDDRTNEKVLLAILSEKQEVLDILSIMKPPSHKWIEYFFGKTFTAKNISLLYDACPCLQNTKSDKCSEYDLFEIINIHHKLYSIHLDYNKQTDYWKEIKSVLHKWVYRQLDNIEVFLLIDKYYKKFDEEFYLKLKEELYFKFTTNENEVISLKERQFSEHKKLITQNLFNMWILFLEYKFKQNYSILHSKFDIIKSTHDNTQLIFESILPEIRFSRKISFSNSNDICCDFFFDRQYLLRLLGKNSAIWRNNPKLLNRIQSLFIHILSTLEGIEVLKCTEQSLIFSTQSIASHEQNSNYFSLSILIELLRDSWLVLKDYDAKKAKETAIQWFNLPYITFKRLALFAANQNQNKKTDISNSTWLDWLLQNNHQILWSMNYRHEVLQLIKRQGKFLNNWQRMQLEKALLKGPSKDLFNFNFETEDKYLSYKKYLQKLYIAKLAKGCKNLSQKSYSFLNAYPKSEIKTIQNSENNEFHIWREANWAETQPTLANFPITQEEVEAFIISTKDYNKEVLKALYQKNSLELVRTFIKLSTQNQFNHEKVRELLFLVAHDKNLAESVHKEILQWLTTLSTDKIIDIQWYFAYYLRELSQTNTYRKEVLSLYEMFFDIIKDAEETHDLEGDYFVKAVNSPIGIATEALTSLWQTEELNDNTSISNDIRVHFRKILTENSKSVLFAKAILASFLYTLYRVDPIWTKEHLLPLLDIAKFQDEAIALWEAFLSYPHLTNNLEEDIKDDLLKLSKHIDKLNESFESYIRLLTFKIFKKTAYTLSYTDFPKIFFSNTKYLDSVAESIIDIIQSISDKEDAWSNYFIPFWTQAWEQDKEYKSEKLSYWLTRFAIEFREKFNVALLLFTEWLEPIQDVMYILSTIQERNIQDIYPSETLDLLNIIISPHTKEYSLCELDEILRSITSKNKELLNHPAFSNPIIQKNYKHYV